VRAQIRHITDYHYPEPAADSFNEVRLQPAHDEYQRLLGFQLYLTPDAPATSHTDYFGTAVHSFHIRQAHTSLCVETAAVVVTHSRPFPNPLPASSLEVHRDKLYEFLQPSKHVPHGDWAAQLEYAALNEDTELVAYLNGLNAHIKARFTYESGVTEIGTPLEEFLRQGSGVCQDYAHLMIAVCREARIPARYVSGYVYAGGDFIGAGATHAWVDCFVPGSGWVGFDPTNGVMQTENHIVIGAGRDYADVPPLRGSRRGGGREQLEVMVSVRSQQQQ
jgi:transglutaminase-like putative cysteine protease